jgi:predicted porin
MGVSSRRIRLCAGVAFSALILVAGSSGASNAQSADAAQIKALQAQIDQLQRTVKELAAKQAQTEDVAQAAKKKAVHAEEQSAKVHEGSGRVPVKAGWMDDVDGQGHRFLEHKKGTAATFYTPGGEVTAYGNFDVSFDAATKNAKSGLVVPADSTGAAPGGTPVGNFGWMPDISTNLSYLGMRGFQRIPGQDFNFVYQFEAGIDISAAPGNKQTNSNLSNQVNGALFSRNTFIGVSSPMYGALKIGKTDAPYKNSTAALNPFVGMWGDYAVVMGNSGGDNRVEFGTRVSHAIWYESPKFLGGFQFNALFAPGQNRATDSGNIASGESDCAGGNDPNSGANPLANCSDGGFSNLYSANLSYTSGPLYITGAYEFHQNVNRQSDIAGAYAIATCAAAPDSVGQQLCTADVANEDAAKVAVMYTFPTKTTIGGIFERMHRYTPAILDFQNERTRNGTWLVVSQELTPMDSIHFGWAHAFKSPGDPGQHNTTTMFMPDLTGGTAYGARNQNQADMLTGAYKHRFSENLLWYTNVAATFNGPTAHYDLGAGGRSVTTDCHDAQAAPGGTNANPACWAGTTLVGVSTGLQWKF